jgi:hypothetical protein
MEKHKLIHVSLLQKKWSVLTVLKYQNWKSNRIEGHNSK